MVTGRTGLERARSGSASRRRVGRTCFGDRRVSRTPKAWGHRGYTKGRRVAASRGPEQHGGLRLCQIREDRRAGGSVLRGRSSTATIRDLSRRSQRSLVPPALLCCPTRSRWTCVSSCVIKQTLRRSAAYSSRDRARRSRHHFSIQSLIVLAVPRSTQGIGGEAPHPIPSAIKFLAARPAHPSGRADYSVRARVEQSPIG